MNEIVSNPVNVCRDICSERRENSTRGVMRNQAKTNPLRMLPASAEHFCVCESNMAAQDGALTTNFNPPLLKNHCKSELQIWEFILLTFNLLYDKK